MTDLSPAAQAVLDAYNAGFIRPVAVHHKPRIAAALRAAADQARRTVATGTPSTDWGEGWKQGAMDVANGFLAIAAELSSSTTENQ
jgi:ABC-type branched-subunit amino acid transport system substrate-binding protein